jgi:hypothetical protein
MATYLGNGQYSLLDVMRQSKNPSINYDGLYQDPDRFSEYDNSRDDHTNQADYPITGNIPTSVLARTDARAYNRNEPLPSAYGEPSRYFNNFNPRIGRPEVVSDFEAGEDGPYLGGNYPENPYPDNTELGDMTGLVTNQFYDQMDKVPTITDMIENNQYNVNDSAMQVMNNAFNQRQIMADETSVGNYPTEPQIASPRFRDASNMAEYLQGNPQIMDNIQNTIGSGIDKFKSGLGSIKDFAMDKGRMGRNLLGSAGAMALGLPGIVGSGAMALMGGLKNQFQDRQLTGDIQDEYGNMYSADELNSQNALGGYYTDPARSARRRTSRIAKMRARDFNNKKISQTNLDRLVRQEKAQQLRDAKDAADRANIQNVQNYTGRELSGYRMSRPASERNYTGGSTNSNPSARGAQDSFSNKSGMGRTGYQEGGLASMFTRRR